jgi:hypothetical protein
MTDREGDAAFVLIVLAVVAPLLALLPVARNVDESIDRQRPMYEDLARVEWLEYQALLDTGSAVPVDVGGGETVVIGDEEFRPSSGVQVVVEVSSPDQFCAQAVNEHGDRSSRWCYDPADPPADPERNASGVTP